MNTAPTSRETWLAERRKRLGATDVSAILGLNPYKTAYEVWLDKRNMLEPWNGNAATSLGLMLEPAILDEAVCLALGKQFQSRAVPVPARIGAAHDAGGHDLLP